MKVLVNGGLNLSELDGWWAEAYASELGWALGDRNEHDANPDWDRQEAESLYRLLEEEVIPLFYHQRDTNGCPCGWVAKIRESMGRLTPQFSSNRMLQDYVTTPLCARQPTACCPPGSRCPRRHLSMAERYCQSLEEPPFWRTDGTV